MLPLLTREQIASTGKRRQPAAVDPASIPADVVDMQMRAQHCIDGFWRKAGASQVLQERAVQMIPCRDLTLFVIAHAGIDDDTLIHRFDDEAMNRCDQLAIVVSKVRLEPGIAMR